MLEKTLDLSGIAPCDLSMFTTVNKKALFIYVIYILGLDIILDDVVKRLWDVRIHAI